MGANRHTYEYKSTIYTHTHINGQIQVSQKNDETELQHLHELVTRLPPLSAGQRLPCVCYSNMMKICWMHQGTILFVWLALIIITLVDFAHSLSPLKTSRQRRLPSAVHDRSSVLPSSRTTALMFSPVDSVFKLVLPQQHRRNGVESSIEAALILTDKKRQEEWKKDIGIKYPLIPSFVVDVCINSMSGAFESIAPAELQALLRPGGLEKARPELEQGIVTSLEKQQVWQGIPLKQDDKRQFLQYIVTMALDYVLRDAELALAAPTAKLRALDAQKRDVQRFMTRRQLLEYRIQTYPLRMALLGATFLYVIYTMYESTKHTWLMSRMTRAVVCGVTHVGMLMKNAGNIFGVSSKQSLQKKALRRFMRRC